MKNIKIFFKQTFIYFYYTVLFILSLIGGAIIPVGLIGFALCNLLTGHILIGIFTLLGGMLWFCGAIVLLNWESYKKSLEPKKLPKEFFDD